MLSNLFLYLVVWVKLWNVLSLNMCKITFIQMIFFLQVSDQFFTRPLNCVQLIEMYDYILKAIDEGKYCCIVFCDLSKAFDRVCHKGLHFKLQSHGTSNHLLR